MPVVPVEQNRVELAQGNSVRERAGDYSGTDGFARGLQGFGEAVNGAGVAAAEIQQHADSIYTRNSDITTTGALDGIRGEYESLQGQSATDQGVAYQAKGAELVKATLDGIGNQRVRRHLEPVLQARLAAFNNGIAEHNRKQQFVFANDTYESGVALAGQLAAGSADKPEEQAQHIGEGRDYLARLGKLHGWDANTTKLNDLKFTSGVHSGVIDQMLASGDNLDGATSYYEAHKGEMSYDAQTKAQQAFKAPLELRDSAQGFSEVTSGAPPAGKGEAATIAPGTYHSPVTGGVVPKGGHFGDVRKGGEVHGGLDIAGIPVGSAIHPIAGGVVIAPRAAPGGDSGINVAVRHPDGTISTYSHMGNASVKPGEVVSATSVLGTVGMTGHTTGPHVHLKVRDASGKAIDPEALLGKNSAAGTVIGTPQAARNWDQASVIANIDKRTDWTFEKRERVKAYARSRMNQDESALQDGYTDAAREAAITIAKLGDNFNSLGQIPSSVRSRMDPLRVAELEKDIRDRAERATAARASETHDMRSMQLEIMRRFEPDKFKKLDPLAEQRNLSGGQFNQFMINYLEATKPQPKAAFDPNAVRSGITSEIAFQEKHGGPKLGDEDKIKAYDFMESQLGAIQKTKGKIEAGDITAAYQTAMRTSAAHGFFGGTKRLYETLSDVPADEEAKIRAAWSGPTPPTKGQVIEVWRRRLTK